ncbi:hypothetical protein COCOBI_14-2790 [Coccomyxa sp. Obi]|nr:hypothetical protein COCOBI_14-2790 [Coccomyxa sp. Obi]
MVIFFPPWRDRPLPQPSAPAPRLQRQHCSPDTVDAAAVARGPQPPWAHVWREEATLTHVFITCPLAASIWGWFAATWAAVTGEDPPPLSADLLLADDQRQWQPASQLTPLWHRLRLAATCQLWASYQRARHQTGAAESAGVVAARLLSSCRKAILGDWRLATVNVRTTSGVLSDWLRGRDPKLTREEFNVPYAFACDTMPIESTNCQQKDSGQRTGAPPAVALQG